MAPMNVFAGHRERRKGRQRACGQRWGEERAGHATYRYHGYHASTLLAGKQTLVGSCCAEKEDWGASPFPSAVMTRRVGWGKGGSRGRDIRVHVLILAYSCC